MTTSQTSPARHTNLLAQEKSPYLLQHAHNPVDWHPWGEDAFAKARAENKPIFLSIGYSTCHWCHVMERESFEDEQVAGVPERAFREHQSGPGGAAGRGQDLHDLRAGDDRSGRLAAERFPHPGSEAVFWRDLFPAGQPPGRPGFPQCCSRSGSSGTRADGDLADSAAEMHATLAGSHGAAARRRPVRTLGRR